MQSKDGHQLHWIYWKSDLSHLPLKGSGERGYLWFFLFDRDNICSLDEPLGVVGGKPFNSTTVRVLDLPLTSGLYAFLHRCQSAAVHSSIGSNFSSYLQKSEIRYLSPNVSIRCLLNAVAGELSFCSCLYLQNTIGYVKNSACLVIQTSLTWILNYLNTEQGCLCRAKFHMHYTMHVRVTKLVC